MEELKACPFCGKQVAEITNCVELEDCANFEACDNCGFVCVVCSANNGGCGATGGYAPTEKQAMEKWNRRTAPENKPLTLEQLRTMDENEPVYLKGKGNAYASLCYLGAGTINHEQDCFAVYYFGLDEADFLDCDDYGKTWLAYTRKPEQEDES